MGSMLDPSLWHPNSKIDLFIPILGNENDYHYLLGLPLFIRIICINSRCSLRLPNKQFIVLLRITACSTISIMSFLIFSWFVLFSLVLLCATKFSSSSSEFLILLIQFSKSHTSISSLTFFLFFVSIIQIAILMQWITQNYKLINRYISYVTTSNIIIQLIEYFI